MALERLEDRSRASVLPQTVGKVLPERNVSPAASERIVKKRVSAGEDKVWTESVSKLETIREPVVIVLGAGEAESPFACALAQDAQGERVCAIRMEGGEKKP